MNNNPVISVVIITYLHENYIKDTLNGVLVQKTNFPIEIIISNDCSPDNSNQVIEDIINKSEIKANIKYFNQPKNLGLMDNFVFALKQAKGNILHFAKVIIIGQTSISFKNNMIFWRKRKCCLCFHNTSVLVESTNEMKNFIGLENYTDNETIPLESLSKERRIVSVSGSCF